METRTVATRDAVHSTRGASSFCVGAIHAAHVFTVCYCANSAYIGCFHCLLLFSFVHAFIACCGDFLHAFRMACCYRVASASPVGDVEPAITAVSVHFKVSVPKGTWKKLLRSRRSAFAASTAAVAGAPEGLMLPCEALDPTTVWDVSAEVETFIKRVLSAYRHRWVHEGLRDLLETAPLPPPPIFTKCLGVVQGKGPLKVEFLDRKGETRLIPADLGTPVLPYSTTLGAVLLARALGMLDDSDLTDFSVLVGYCCS